MLNHGPCNLISGCKNGAGQSAQEQVLAPSTIGQNGVVDHLATGTAFPGIEDPYKVIKLFCVHPAFAFWASHLVSPFVN